MANNARGQRLPSAACLHKTSDSGGGCPSSDVIRVLCICLCLPPLSEVATSLVGFLHLSPVCEDLRVWLGSLHPPATQLPRLDLGSGSHLLNSSGSILSLVLKAEQGGGEKHPEKPIQNSPGLGVTRLCLLGALTQNPVCSPEGSQQIAGCLRWRWELVRAGESW